MNQRGYGLLTVFFFGGGGGQWLSLYNLESKNTIKIKKFNVEQFVLLIVVVVLWVQILCDTTRSELVVTASDWLVEGSVSAGSFDLPGWSSRG